jgi:hypothetical protein
MLRFFKIPTFFYCFCAAYQLQSEHQKALFIFFIFRKLNILFSAVPKQPGTLSGFFSSRRTHFGFSCVPFLKAAKIHYFDDYLSETQVQYVTPIEIANNSASV